MKIRSLAIALMLATIAGCAAAPIRVSVPGFTIPSGQSANHICYVEVTESAPVRFRSVHYEADARFKPGPGLPSQEVDVVIYGRAEAPENVSNPSRYCVEANETEGNIQLSETVPISITGTRVRVGGEKLASLVVQERYWIGASITESGLTIGSEIEFDQGTVTAVLF